MTDSRPTLVVIDVQRAFDDPRWGPRNNPQAETKVAMLLERWRAAEAPIIHVRHRSNAPHGLFAGDGLRCKEVAEPQSGEVVIEKVVHSGFIGTDLEQRLRALGTETVVVVGFTTDHCCSTTARMAADLGFTVLFVSDATATFARTRLGGRSYSADEIHESALASLDGEFATVIEAADAARRLGHSD